MKTVLFIVILLGSACIYLQKQYIEFLKSEIDHEHELRIHAPVPDCKPMNLDTVCPSWYFNSDLLKVRRRICGK